jgi:uncharacterized protein (DUF433 family)
MSALMRKIAARLRNRTFSVAEASAMTGMSSIQVNNAIEEIARFGMAHSKGGKRFVEYNGIFCLLLVQDMTGWARPNLRREIIEGALKSRRKAIHAVSENVAVPVDGLRKKAQEALRSLYEAEDNIVSNADVLSGEPCLKGTRIPAHAVAAIANQLGVDEAIATYPQLAARKVELALLFCKANPRRGRPKKSGSNSKTIGRVRARQGGKREEDTTQSPD